ncbi:uncharacterized protein LOC141932607 [Strix aluco]|uniref:uncharacterized protein LOC141932607 n=1 Tax=Strix aluco TaxID=111821 RepID=UPI003DA593D3
MAGCCFHPGFGGLHPSSPHSLMEAMEHGWKPRWLRPTAGCPRPPNDPGEHHLGQVEQLQQGPPEGEPPAPGDHMGPEDLSGSTGEQGEGDGQVASMLREELRSWGQSRGRSGASWRKEAAAALRYTGPSKGPGACSGTRWDAGEELPVLGLSAARGHVARAPRRWGDTAPRAALATKRAVTGLRRGARTPPALEAPGFWPKTTSLKNDEASPETSRCSSVGAAHGRC